MPVSLAESAALKGLKPEGRAGNESGLAGRAPLIVNIQLLRFLAALAVVLFHAQPVFSPGGKGGAANIGFAGVDVFFVISGFIMWYTTRGMQGPADAGWFIRRRFARIFSGYWPYLFIAWVLLAVFEPQQLARKSLLESFLLLPIPIGDRILPLSWTLTFELWFYLLFALLIFLPRHWMGRLVVWLVLLLVLLNGVGVAALGFYDASFFGSVPPSLRLMISPYVVEFLAGCLVARAFMAGFRLSPLFSLILAAAFFAAGWLYDEQVLGGGLDQGYHVVERVLFFGTGSVALVYAMAEFERRGLRVWPLLGRWLGGASYSLYLSHTLLFFLVLHLPLDAERQESWSMLIAVLLVIAYSLLHYRWIEQPLYGLMKTWLGVDRPVSK